MITTHILHTARLKNNCPECFDAEGLEFIFSHQIDDNTFFRKQGVEITEKLLCHNCNNTIYPERWGTDLELVHAYHKKLAQPENSRMILKPLTIGLIVFGIFILVAIIGMAISF